MNRQLRVLLVDGSAARRSAVRNVVDDLPATVVGEAGYGVRAIRVAEETRPDVVLVSLAGPRDRALRTLRALQACDAKIFTLIDSPDRTLLRDLLALDVREWLPGIPTAETLRQALSGQVAPGGTLDQTGRTLDQIANPRGNVVTVFGTKGGIGKTTVATNLGALLAVEAGLSVLLIDMDTRFGDVGLMLNVAPGHTVVQLAQNVADLDRRSFKESVALHESGLHVLAAPTSVEQWGAVSATQMHALIEFAARLYDMVVLDTPGVFNDLVDMAVGTADQIVVMSTLDTTSLRNTVRVLEALEQSETPDEIIFLTLNQVNRFTVLDRGRFQQILHRPVVVEIPYEERVADAGAHGCPIVTRSPRNQAARAVRELARRLTGLELAEPDPWYLRLWPGRRGRRSAAEGPLRRSA